MNFNARGFWVNLELGSPIAVCLLLFSQPLLAAECAEEPASSEECPPTIPTVGTRNPLAEAQSFGVAGTLTRRRFSIAHSCVDPSSTCCECAPASDTLTLPSELWRKAAR